MAQEKQYRILVVERDANIRERIASTLSMADLNSSVAEEKSVARAITHLLNAELNVLVIGPTLDIEEAKKLHLCPSNFGQRVVICFDEDIANQLKCKNILKLPFLPEDGKVVVESAFRSSPEVQDFEEANETRVSEAMQLAYVISRLVERLERVSTALKKQPKDLKLNAGSIPEAVNTIIAGASMIRQGQESQDIKDLIGKLFK